LTGTVSSAAYLKMFVRSARISTGGLAIKEAAQPEVLLFQGPGKSTKVTFLIF